jgi:hypothetical protein
VIFSLHRCSVISGVLVGEVSSIPASGSSLAFLLGICHAGGNGWCPRRGLLPPLSARKERLATFAASLLDSTRRSNDYGAWDPQDFHSMSGCSRSSDVLLVISPLQHVIRAVSFLFQKYTCIAIRTWSLATRFGLDLSNREPLSKWRTREVSYAHCWPLY